MDSMRSRLSTLWLFALLNYLYCDVVTLMDPAMLRQFLAGSVGGAEITPTVLAAAGILMEIPIAMVLVARLLAHPRANRWANILAGAVMTAVQLGSVVAKLPPAPYYVLFSAIEVAATIAIAWTAWRWSARTAGVPAASVAAAADAVR